MSQRREEPRHVWRLMAYHEPHRRGRMIEKMIEIGAVCLGWGRIGDLHGLQPRDDARIVTAITNAYPGLGPSNRGDGRRSLWRMFTEIHPKDLVLVRGDGNDAVFEITGPYTFVEEDLDLEDGEEVVDDYYHRLPAHLAPEDLAQRVFENYRFRSGKGVSVRHALVPMERRVPLRPVTPQR